MYNPFSIKIDQVTEAELSILREVNEGWYIEYKRELPSAAKVAKSISSFANSYGGLYIIGVEADEQNKASSFPGITPTMNFFHDAVRGNLNPFPYFETYSIPLANGNYVVLVHVEPGNNTPYVHNDGRIYRRQESSSDPVPETNRQVLDILYQRAEKNNEERKSFRYIDYGFAKGEDDTLFISGYLSTEFLEKSLIYDFNEIDFPDKILEFFSSGFEYHNPETISINGKIEFDNVVMHDESAILRNLSGINLAYHTTTIELFRNGSIRYNFPVQKINLYDIDNSEGILKYCEEKKIDITSFVIRWVNLRDIASPALGILAKYFDWLQKYSYNDPLEVSFSADNCFRICIISDTEEYVSYLNKKAFPIILKTSISYPRVPSKWSTDYIYKNRANSLFGFLSQSLNGLGIQGPTALSMYIIDMKNKQKNGAN